MANAEAVKKYRKRLKLKAIEYKGSECCLCGYSRCVRALGFHHLDPTKKSFGISHKGITYSWERMKAELDKTVMVCANCHAEIEESIAQ